MSKIITITLNSAFDNIIHIDSLVEGSVIRAKKSHNYVSGKGINSARALAQMDVETLNIAFVGRESKFLFKSFNTEGIKVKPIYSPGHTRFNTTIVTEHKGLTTHIQTKGYALKAQYISRLKQILKQTLSPHDVVILSGSLPEGLDMDTYSGLIKFCKKSDCVTLFDSSGEALKHGLNAIPYLMKPNEEEFESLCNIKRTTENLSEIISAMQEFNKIGIELVVLSLGKEGVLIASKSDSEVYKASLHVDPLSITGEDIGCGDSLVAGLAYALCKKKSLIDTIKVGLSFGAANLFKPGPGNIDAKRIDAFLSEVQITKLR